ncbi:MAG: MATE family efflux transporter [Methanimicrococcus sp.]|nr:MATE family efflux transporter [Methanimicrococcus sp.]
METKLEQLNNRGVKTALARLSFPAMVGIFIQMLYGLVDSVFVGRGLGEDGIIGLSALTIAFPLSYLILSVASGISVGGSSYISRSMGALEKVRVEKGIGNMIILAFAAGVFFTIFGLLFLDPILKVFGATPVILPFARDYMFWIILGCTFQILTMTVNAVVMAEGNAIFSMKMYTASSILNVILDYIFIFHFGWGIQGAAIATSLCQVFNVMILIYYLYGVSKLKFRLKWIVFDMKTSLDIIKVGVSEFVRESSLVFMFIIVNYNLKIHGDTSSFAIFGIINRIFGFVIIPVIGIVQGMIPLTGFNYGAKKFQNVRDILKISVKWSILLSFIIGAFTYIFTAPLLSLFITDPVVVKEGVIAYWIADISIPIVAFQIIGSAFTQALGKARVSFILTISRQVFILPTLFIIPHFMGLIGVWVAFPVVDLLAGILTLWFVLRQLKLLKKEERVNTAAAV